MSCTSSTSEEWYGVSIPLDGGVRTLRPQFAVRITPADVGKRVTIRYRITAEGDGPHHSDAVGVLEAWADGELAVTNRHGETSMIAEADMVAGRVVGPPPTRRAR